MKCHLNTICFAYSLISETDTHLGEILCCRRFGETTKRIKHFIHKHTKCATSFARRLRSSTSYSMQKGNKNKCILCSHTMQIDHRPNEWWTTNDAIAHAHYERNGIINKNMRPAGGRHILSIDTIIIISLWNTRKWHATAARSLSPVAIGSEVTGNISHERRACVCLSVLKPNWNIILVSLFFLYSFLVLCRFRPPMQRRTNGSNVSIARATMTTYGFIILWYHKYEICECALPLCFYFFVFSFCDFPRSFASHFSLFYERLVCCTQHNLIYVNYASELLFSICWR